jgi:HK97 family phage portal protein
MGFRSAWHSLWTKESAAGKIISVQKVGKPQWSNRNYEKFADEGYKRNVIAYRCVDIISKSAAAIPLCLYSGDTELETHPLLDLLRKPNPMQGGADLLRNHFAFSLIAGNAYPEAVGPDGRAPMELYTLRPDRVKVIAGPYGVPQAYTYTVGSTTQRWDVDPITGQGLVSHYKMFNPLDDWYGMSPIEAAAYAIDQHNEAGKWNMALLQNSGGPSGAMIYKPAEAGSRMSDEQFDRMHKEIDEKISGAKNAGRPLLLEEMDWKQMALSPKDMDWLNGKNLSAVEICDAYGVPTQIHGLEGSQTFANYEQARLALYEDTVIPFLDSHVDHLNNWLVPMFGDGLKLVADLDEISALEPRRKEKWDKITTAGFLTINEQREALGYDTIEGGDEILVPATLVPLEVAMNPPDPVDPNVPEDPAAAGKMAYGK